MRWKLQYYDPLSKWLRNDAVHAIRNDSKLLFLLRIVSNTLKKSPLSLIIAAS